MRLADPVKSRIILVGNASYEDPKLQDLPAVRNNVTELAKILVDPQLGGLSPDACHVFVDLRSDEAWQIAELASQAEDVLLVYFAGHGLLADDGRLLLGLANTKDDYPIYTALQMDHVHNALRSSMATTRVLIVDCCYAERALKGMMGGPEELMEVDGAYTLASASANQSAIAPLGEEYSAFSGELISLLRNGIKDGSELLSMDTVYRSLVRTLSDKGLPTPKQFHSNTASSLALARNPRFRVVPPELVPVRWIELRRIVLDADRDFDARVDAVEALAARAADDPEIQEELASLAANARLPILVRVRCVHELGVLGNDRSAVDSLETIVGPGRGAGALQKLRWFAGLLEDDGRWYEAMAANWDQDGGLASLARADDDELWGALVAMMLTEAGFSLTTRLQVSHELAALGHRNQAESVLRALLRDRRLGERGHDRVTAAIGYLTSP
jgi:hypothetical protein